MIREANCIQKTFVERKTEMKKLRIQKTLCSIWLCLLTLFSLGCGNGVSSTTTFHEPSGIVRCGNEILYVEDSDQGAYCKVPILMSEQTIPLSPSEIIRVAWPEAKLAIDLESIEVLADGRVVLLSERLHALVGRSGIIVDYDEPLSALGKRGLEGLAVRPLPEGASRIAVLWEGGYPSGSNLLPQVKAKIEGAALSPLVVIHDLKPDESGVILKFDEKPEKPDRRVSRLIELKVPKPPGSEPMAHRFRAPDLVWNQNKESGWGFIVLLSSHNSPLKGPREKFKYQELRQFSVDGKALEDPGPIDLKLVLPEKLREVNWEGLDWFEEGKSLILAHEASIEGEKPMAYILELPGEWQRN